MTPTQRTLALLRERGWRHDIVERFNRFVGPHGQRHDFCHMFDIIAFAPSVGIVGVQSCGQAYSDHVTKLLSDVCAPALREWLLSGGKAELIGWRKKKAVLCNGKKGNSYRWYPRVADIVLRPDETLSVNERKL